jgi:O-antigen/teichoic acid export membrane protein
MAPPPADQPRGRISALIGRVTGGRDGAPASLADLRGSDTAKAAGLAAAMIVNNVVALGSTVVFARLLKDNQGGGYGSLAALVSYFLILSVVGQALQVATAREGVLGHLGTGAALVATIRSWTRVMAWVTVAIAIVSVVLRDPIASAVGVKHDEWAAAIGLPAAALWLELSILRGVLQGVGDYAGVGISLIGEQTARLITGAILAAAGLGVTGAFLGTPLSFVAMGLFCVSRLRRHLHALAQDGDAATAAAPATAAFSLWEHVRRAWAPIGGLIVVAVLQNIDIIAAKHRFSTSLASSYGATAVAAKVLIWVAMGAGFYLVPEVSRRRAAGEDTRPILVRALGIVAVCAVPVLLIFGFESHLLIKLAFGAKKAHASNALLMLGLAFTVLAATYLAIQYLLALRRTWFLLALAVVAVIEPVALLNASRHPAGFAAVVLAVQALGAIVAFAFALRRQPPPAVAPEAEPPAAETQPVAETVA